MENATSPFLYLFISPLYDLKVVCENGAVSKTQFILQSNVTSIYLD